MEKRGGAIGKRGQAFFIALAVYAFVMAVGLYVYFQGGPTLQFAPGVYGYCTDSVTGQTQWVNDVQCNPGNQNPLPGESCPANTQGTVSCDGSCKIQRDCKTFCGNGIVENPNQANPPFAESCEVGVACVQPAPDCNGLQKQQRNMVCNNCVCTEGAPTPLGCDSTLCGGCSSNSDCPQAASTCQNEDTLNHPDSKMSIVSSGSTCDTSDCGCDPPSIEIKCVGGSCGAACDADSPTQSSGQVCNTATCAFECPSGQTLCSNGICGSSCSCTPPSNYDDGNALTADSYITPGTPGTTCVITHTCTCDSTKCDDGDSTTTDGCSSEPNVCACTHTPIVCPSCPSDTTECAGTSLMSYTYLPAVAPLCLCNRDSSVLESCSSQCSGVTCNPITGCSDRNVCLGLKSQPQTGTCNNCGCSYGDSGASSCSTGCGAVCSSSDVSQCTLTSDCEKNYGDTSSPFAVSLSPVCDSTSCGCKYEISNVPNKKCDMSCGAGCGSNADCSESEVCGDNCQCACPSGTSKCADGLCKASCCGDGKINYGDVCDGSDLGGKKCSDISPFDNGILACGASCVFNTDSCTQCGNGRCESPFENKDNCPVDCPYCGDGSCNNGETKQTCGQDCCGANGNGCSLNVVSEKPGINSVATAMVIYSIEGVSSEGVNFTWNATDEVFDSVNCNLTVDNKVEGAGIFSESGKDTTLGIDELAQGEHLWNVTCWNALGNRAVSETRSLTVAGETIPPVVEFVEPTDSDLSILRRNYIIMNVTAFDNNFEVVTLRVYDSGGNMVSETNSRDENAYVKVSNLKDGKYTFNAVALDYFGNVGSSETREVDVEAEGPLVLFVQPTESEGSSLREGIIRINVTAQDENFSNLTLFVESDFGLIYNQTTSSTGIYVKLNNLSDGTYRFYGRASDIFGNIGESSKRRVVVNTKVRVPVNDTTPPIVTIVEPRPVVYGINGYTILFVTNEQSTCEYSLDGGATRELADAQRGGTRFVGQETGMANGDYTLIAYCADTSGNVGNASVSFTINYTMPLIPIKKAPETPVVLAPPAVFPWWLILLLVLIALLIWALIFFLGRKRKKDLMMKYVELGNKMEGEINAGNIDSARVIYGQMQAIYPRLSKEDKAKVMAGSQALYNKLLDAIAGHVEESIKVGTADSGGLGG